MLKKRLTSAGLMMALLLVTLACNLSYFEEAEIGDIIFDPSIALPVGEITYSVEELFDELNDAGADIGSNNENVVTLSYSETLQSQTASSFLAVVDQNFNSSLAAGTSLSNPPVTTVIQVNELFEFDLSQRGGELYDSLTFTGGNFGVNITSDFNAQINFDITFLSLEQNGMPLVVSGTLDAANPNLAQNESLANYTGLFHLDDQGNTTSNKFLVRMEYEIVVTPTTSIAATDEITFTVNISDTSFQTVYGNVGSQDLTVSFDVVNLDFFNNFDQGSIGFADPRISLVFDNSYGFPLGISFPEFAAITSEGTILPLQGSAATTTTIVGAPTVDNIGQIVRTNLDLNRDNSNLPDLISAQPTKIVVDVNTQANPPTTPFQYNFVDNASILDIAVEIEIPLELNLNQVAAEEVIEFGSGGDLEEAKRLLFRVISENELPLGGEIELQFQDANGTTLYTVDQTSAFVGAPVGSDGRTSSVATSTTDIVLEDAAIRAIEGATQINVVATLTTTDAAQSVAVKFFSDYELKFRLALQADVEINSNGE